MTPDRCIQELCLAAEWIEHSPRPSRSFLASFLKALYSSLEKNALPKEWKLITDEQIERVMELLPPGSKIYGSHATGKAHQNSDLDVKLPENVGEDALSKLMVKIMRDLDLYVGSLNLSMPCEEHDGCTIMAHTGESNLFPSIEHLGGGLVDPDELPEPKKRMRDEAKSRAKRFVEELETDEYFRLSDDDKEMLDQYLSGKSKDEAIEWLLKKYRPE